MNAVLAILILALNSVTATGAELVYSADVLANEYKIDVLISQDCAGRAETSSDRVNKPCRQERTRNPFAREILRKLEAMKFPKGVENLPRLEIGGERWTCVFLNARDPRPIFSNESLVAYQVDECNLDRTLATLQKRLQAPPQQAETNRSRLRKEYGILLVGLTKSPNCTKWVGTDKAGWQNVYDFVPCYNDNELEELARAVLAELQILKFPKAISNMPLFYVNRPYQWGGSCYSNEEDPHPTGQNFTLFGRCNLRSTLMELMLMIQY